MTRKYLKRTSSGQNGSIKTAIKTLEQHPTKFASAICPLNLEEQKERFLKYGKVPKFVLKGTEDEIENLFNKASNQIRFDLFCEAEHILHTVREKYGDGQKYLEAMYGQKISKESANEILVDYLKDNNLDGAMSIVWCNDLVSSAKMMWIGPHSKFNKPEARNYSFWIKNADDNNFIREFGIRCLADHEIGTHFFRSFNDGLQPWYSDRKRFGVRGLGSLEQLRTEEGLACINTVLNAKERYLWSSALQYYAACKSAEMTFKQLFDHLIVFVKSPDHRWRLCMRVKRGLIDPNDLGGYGKDQCYFEGAVEILRNIDNIDFQVLMSGKMCVDEVSRCKRVSRQNCIRLPAFMRNEAKYKKNLKAIANINGLNTVRPRGQAPVAYIQRLKRGRRIGPGENTQKVRKRVAKGRGCKYRGKSQSSDSFSSTESECDDVSRVSFKSKTSQVSEKIKKNFLLESTGNDGIVPTADLIHHDAGIDPTSLKLEQTVMQSGKENTECFNNNALEIENSTQNLQERSSIGQQSFTLGSSWSLHSCQSSRNSNVCTSFVHEEDNAGWNINNEEVKPHGHHSRFSAFSYLTDFDVQRLKSAGHNSPVFSPSSSPELNCHDMSKVVKTFCESGRQKFIYPEKSSLIESSDNIRPTVSVNEGHIPRVQSERLMSPYAQLPKLLHRRAKSAVNRLSNS